MSGPPSIPSARDESILAHTNVLSLHLAPVDANAVASPSVIALQKQIAAYLPSREWFRIPTLEQLEPMTGTYVSHFSMQHGTALPTLSVRVLPSHVICDEVRGRELDASLQWLMESISVGSSYPVLGLDCESDCTLESDGEVRLLQLSTGTRCLLIRVPPQSALREVVGHAAFEKQFATASGTIGITQPTTAANANPLFTPLFHSLLSNRSIFKSGAELWTDALDLWACTGTGPGSASSTSVTAPGVEMNSCLNMSWIWRNEHGGALSLAAMVNLSLGSERCFLKDKPTTTSDWGAKELNLRQLIYAALDAQASFIAGANQSQIPKPFHVGDMPRSWLSSAAAWKQVLRANKMAREQLARNQIGVGVINRYDPTADALLDASFRYFAQVLQGEEPFHPFLSILLQIPFPSNASLAQATMPPPNAHLIQIPHQQRTMTLSPTYFQGEDLAIETSNVSWWFNTTMEPSPSATTSNHRPKHTNGQNDPADLGEILDRTRISVILAGVGSGKTTAASLEALRSLQRPSSVPLDHAPLEMRAIGQRVLFLTETEHAARAAAESMAKFVSPADAMLLVSPTYLASWDAEPPSESSNRAKALVPPNDDEDRAILICAMDYALSLSAGATNGDSNGASAWRLHHRQTVLVDDAAQVWLLKLVLLLRRLPHTERLILFGDERSYSARWGDLVVDDVLTAALAASRSTAIRSPAPFKVQRHRLHTQWRLSPHIAAAISDIFYLGHLSLGAQSDDTSLKRRGIGWVDLEPDEQPWSQLRTLWKHYRIQGLRPDQIVVLVLSEHVRASLHAHASMGPTTEEDMLLLARTHTPESFQGREAQVAMLILERGIDKRRLLVACSRAARKLFLLGDRAGLIENNATASGTNDHRLIPSGDHALQLLAEFEQKEVEDACNSVRGAGSMNGTSNLNDFNSSSSSSSSYDGSEEVFPVLAGAQPSSTTVGVGASTRLTPPKSATSKAIPEVPSTTSASWAGTLSFAKQTDAAKPPTSSSNIVDTTTASSDVRAKKPIASTAAAIVERKSSSAATAAAVASKVPVYQDPTPVIEFQSAPENRAWKVLPCDKLHAVDGRRPSGTCHLGEKCGFLHNDFWIRRGAVGEFVLFTPGSKIALVEVVEPWNDRRLRQMEHLVDSKLNRINRERGAREFAHLFPEEAPLEEPTTPPVTVVATNHTQQTTKMTKHVTPAPTKSVSNTVNANVGVPLVTPDSSLVDRVDDPVSRRANKRGRKKVAPPQQHFEDESATSSVQATGADDFVPVSRRHAAKHATQEDLAAIAAAEEAAAEEAAAAAAAREKQAQADAAAKRRKQQQEEEEAAAAALAAEEAEAAAAEAAAAEEEERLAKKRSAEPEPAVDYAPDMVPGSWWLADELAALSKNARKKLLWLCPACRAPNANGDAKCSLCSGSKPLSAAIRYAKPPGALGPLPREVEGKYAYESEWVKLVAPSNSNGAPQFVASKPIPAGTVILREDAFYSEIVSGPKAALVPQPRSCAQLAAQLQADPVQMALLRARWSANPWSDGQLKLFLRNAESASGVPSLKPKDPNQIKEWGMAMAWAATAKYAREDQEGHAMEVRKNTQNRRTPRSQVDERSRSEINALQLFFVVCSFFFLQCKCHRFKLPRQSAILVPSCWPNTAVVCLHTDPMLTPDQMAILAVTDIPAGTVLTNVSDQALLNLPADRRQQTISLAKYRSTGRACHCERCVGKLASEQEKLLLQEIPGYTVDKTRMTAEYDKVMIAYSETQHSKLRVYKNTMVKDKDGRDVLATPPKDGVSDAAYFALCYAFLTRAFDFLTTHPLHPCHWRMQKVRELYLSLVRCDFLYRMDYMTLSGLVAPEGQHATLRQIVHVLDAAIRSDQQFFLAMEPMKVSSRERERETL